MLWAGPIRFGTNLTLAGAEDIKAADIYKETCQKNSHETIRQRGRYEEGVVEDGVHATGHVQDAVGASAKTSTGRNKHVPRKFRE